MTRLRAWWRAIFPRRCRWCGGSGETTGYSPFDSLATFRRVQLLTCRHCGGSGHQADAAVADANERAMWERILGSQGREVIRAPRNTA